MPRTKPELDVRRAHSSVCTLNAHLVLVSKYRRPVFTDRMLSFCEHTMREVCAGVGAQLREFNGQTDHVHVLVHYPPSLALSVLVNRLKGVSSRRLRQQYPAQVPKYLWGKHFWSPSYFTASSGGAPLNPYRRAVDRVRSDQSAAAHTHQEPGQDPVRYRHPARAALVGIAKRRGRRLAHHAARHPQDGGGFVGVPGAELSTQLFDTFSTAQARRGT